ncbi:hypothetical protein [Gelidibacter gilvus]|uniref:YARHG domain-containing protein n=1 Tax=Gelidibacter gilvus TaxID=59602 RepID=A0A4V1LN68_9FLAO|nr:hypothetical protein [Gelidibacter gilvus]RXJ51236.1 hypothetical protein ESZ48_05020 [Gelidibacter gilvus]
MILPHKSFLLLAFVIPLFSFSQNEFLDYGIDRKNDTTYGTIRNAITKNGLLVEKNPKSTENRLMFRTHKLRHYKKIRFNDDMYWYEKPSVTDGIYTQSTPRIIPEDSIAKRFGDFINVQKRLPDFVVTKTNDTIYGKFRDPIFWKFHFLDTDNVKIKIEKDHIKAYRFNNDIYIHKEKRKATIFDKDGAYLKLVLDGRITLYEYEHIYKTMDPTTHLPTQNKVVYLYIEKGEAALLLDGFLNKKQLAKLFEDNQPLVSKILNEEYIMENMYLMVKYYNTMNRESL